MRVLLLLLGTLLLTAETTESGFQIALTNSTYVQIVNPLQDVRTAQAWLSPSSTAQAFTIQFLDGSTAEIPSGGVFTFRYPRPIRAGSPLFSARTASSSANLQVVVFKDVR